ncbi:MAG: response regulator [Thermoanaerobaculia bacterium]
MSGLEQGQSGPCSHCLMPFDLASAALCRCVTRERTFVCPHCGACACDASFRAKTEFWRTASPALLARRRKEQSEGIGRLLALDPKSVPRPFALIVDDDPLVLMMAEKALRAIGFTTLAISNPEEAYSIAEAILPDLLLTDALMPKLDGRELCLRLKSNERTSGIRIVVMSALYRGSAYRSEAFKKFLVDEYLEKPIKPGILRETVDRLMPGVAQVKTAS